MYNCDFDEKEFKGGHSFLNEEDPKGGSYNSLEIFEANDSSDEGTSKENGKARGVVRRGYVAMNTGEDDSADGASDGESTKGSSSNRNGKNQPLKRERFTHSFNEDSSFEVNDVHAAILNAEEKTTNYSDDYFGYNIEPFNMKNELKEGYIDKHGNYVYNDPDGDDFEEAWLKSVDEEDPFTSFSNKKIKAKIHKETVCKFDKMQNQSVSNNSLSVNIYDALYSLSCLLIEKETPIKAMVRYKKDLKLCKNYLNECKLKLDKFSFVSAPRPSNESSADPSASKLCQGVDAHPSGADQGKRDEDGGAAPRGSAKKNVLQVNLKRRGGDAKEEAKEEEAVEKESVEREAEEKEPMEKEHMENEAAENEAVNKAEVDSEGPPNGDPQSEEGEKSEATAHEEHSTEQEGQPRQEEPPAEEEAADLVEKAADQVEKAADQVEKAADQVEKAADQVEKAADQVEKTADQVEKTADQVEKTADQVEKTADQVEKAADDNSTLAEGEQPNELQRLEETYQKIALDYKTIERRFNNLIDLTQKLTNEYKNVYFLAKHECEALCKKLEESKEESGDIQWQLRWTSDANNNVYGPYSYYDIYNLISVGIVSAENPIQLRRINKENKVLENIWQMYDAVNYLTFVSNESVKKKRKLSETNQVDAEEDGSDEGDNSVDDEYDIKKKKRKKKGLIQISKKKEEPSTREDDSDNEEEDDDYESYDY